VIIVFQKKQISAILGCTVLLAIILLNLTGCGGGGGNDDPVVYRLVKMETYADANATTAYKTDTVSYDASGNPVQVVDIEVEGGITTRTIAAMTVTFTDGLLSSHKMSGTISGRNFVSIIRFEHPGGELKKYTQYSSENASDLGDEYCTIEYENGKRSKWASYEYDVDTGYPLSPSDCAKYVYTGNKITEIDHCSSTYSDKTNYTRYEYDSNGNIAKKIDYDYNGTTWTEGEHAVYTWEKGKSTYDWNNYTILLP
jgi:hypothetical protein